MVALADTPDNLKKDGDLSLNPNVSVTEGTVVAVGENGGLPENVTLKMYKRRFFGFTLLWLLNLIMSWNFVIYAFAGEYVAEHFNTSAAAVNWFSTAYLFAGVLGFYPASLALRKNTKTSMIYAGAISLAGSWLKYGGARIGNTVLAMFGQIFIGFAQPFVVIAPVFYSEEWFNERSRTTATSVSSIPGVFGGVMASLITPAWILGPSDVAPVTLYVSIITTGVAVFVPFIPAGPPTPPELEVVERHQKVHWLKEVKALLSSVEFYLVAIPFILGSALFNLISTILYPVLVPFGFSFTDIGYASTITIVVGEGLSLILSPFCDRYKCHLYILKTCVVLGAASYIMLIWVPPSGSRSFLFGQCALLSIAYIAPNPINMEFIAEILYPLRVEYAIAIMWAFGNFFGGVLIVASSYMIDAAGTNMPAVYMCVGVACVNLPLVLSLGLFGRKHKVSPNRSNDERRLREELAAQD